jgi:precorrin-2 dehydrogenase/sirohydrochlorin ferrochelatase
MDHTDIPPGGGSLILAWQLKDKRVLIVGGGEVASTRIRSILATDAHITVIAPSNGLHPESKFYIENSPRISHIDRVFSGKDDLEGADIVLTAIDDNEWSQRICTMCRALKIPVNVADVPALCDFYFGSHIRKGALQIMVSTNGKGPKLANIIKQHVENGLPENVDLAIERVGELRVKLRDRAPGIGGDLGRKRMRWMSSICTQWSLESLAQLDERTMVKLLDDGWENSLVPKPEDIGVPTKTKAAQAFPVIPLFLGFVAGAAATVAVTLLRQHR